MTKQKAVMGRPVLPEGEAKDVQVGVRFNAQDNTTIEKAMKDSGQTKADWVRNAAVSQANNPPVWVKSKWKSVELHDKLIEFKFTVPTHWVEGIGKLRVVGNPKGELRIDIVVTIHEAAYTMTDHIYHLYQPVADKIELHPNQDRANFRVLA